jgi:hypothetical protein
MTFHYRYLYVYQALQSALCGNVMSDIKQCNCSLFGTGVIVT